MLLRESATSHYRAKAFRANGPVDYRYLSYEGDINELVAWLDNEVLDDRATGGDIEMYVPRIGWVVYND